MALLRFIAIVALVGLLIQAAWSFRTVVELGQSPLLQPGAWVSSERRINDPFHKPRFMSTEPFLGLEIAEVHATPNGMTLVRSLDGDWYISGFSPSQTSESPYATYGLVKLNISGTFLEPGVELQDMRLAVSRTGTFLEPLQAIVKDVVSNISQRIEFPPSNGTFPDFWVIDTLSSDAPVTHFECGPHVCVLIQDGMPYVYGNDGGNRLYGPDEVLNQFNFPRNISLGWVDPPVWDVRNLAIGANHISVVNGDQKVISWGINFQYQLGSTDAGAYNGSVDIPGFIVGLSAGNSHNLALTAAGRVYAWGANHRGQLANVNPDPSALPLLVILPDVTSVHAWVHTSMAITAAGELYMWGSNQGGRTEGFVVGDNGFYTDGPVGVFGNPDSTIMYQSVPFVVDWSVFLGPNVLFRDIVKFQGCQTNPYEYYIDVSCRLLAIVDVPNQPSLGPVVHPTPEPVSPGNLVAFSWGSRTFTGNPDQPTSTNVLPGISIASLPRAGQYDRVWSAPSVTYIRDASDGSIWFWGRTDAKSPIASGPQWIPPTIYRPINTFRDLGIDSSVLHFAVCELTTAAVYAEEPSVIYIKEPAVAHQVGPSTVTDLICGGTAFAALLSNGTVWTVAQDSSAQFGQLGHPGSSAGILSSSEGMEVFLIAGSGNAFAIWGNNGTANVLSTWGGFPLGYYSEIYTSTPAPVNMDAVNSVITWNSVTKLEGDYNNFMVLLDTGDLIGFGSLLSILDISYDYDAAIVLRASHFSSPISQISLMEGSLLILLSDNRLFAMGESKRLEGDVPNWYPFQSQAQVVPSPVQLFVDPIEGMAYEITVLPRSCSVQASDFDDIGPVVIARATGPASPPNLVEQSHQLMSFGDNHGGPSYLGKQITYLGAPDFYPFQPSPRTSFKDFQMAGGFDFDLLDANYTFSTQTAFALHGTTLWAWGQKPQFAPIGEYIGYIPPTKVGHDVVAVAAFDYGALVIRTNSSLQCINIQEDSLYSSPLCGNSVFSAGIMFKEVSSVSKWDRVACGATVCVAFNNTQPDTPVAMWGNPNTAAHFAIPPDTFLVPHLVDVVVAGSDCLPDEGMLHYHYSENGVDFIFGSGSLNEPGVIVPVGLDASGAIKFVAGRFHVMVLFSNGLIFGWGSNEQRQLSPIGAVDWFASAIPVYDALFGGNVVDIGAVNMASLALMSDGALYTWGVDRQISELIVNPAFAICTMRRPISSASPCRQEPSMRIPCGEPPRRIEPQTRITRLFSAPAASGQTTETYKTQFQPFVLGILPAAPNANQPGCNGPPPTTTAFCTFNGGRWVWRINGDVTVTISSPFDASDDVQINGNLEVNDAGALVLRFKPDGSLAKVNVSGCARLNQPITASLSESDIKRLDKADKIDPQTVVECNCTQTGEIKTLVAVEAPKSCRKASATTEESQSGGRTSLNTLFKVNSKSCNNWWIILVSVLGGVLILVGAFLIALAASPKLRSIILPYEGSN